MRNKKALSTVVTSLIIILLVLVSIGIVWVVMRNVLESGSSQAGVLAKCNLVDVRTISAVNNSNSVTVVVQRKPGASDADIGGIKLAFNLKNGSFGSTLVDVPKDNVNKFEVAGSYTLIKSFTEIGLAGANNGFGKVDLTVYFTDVTTGEKKLCPSSTSFSF